MGLLYTKNNFEIDADIKSIKMYGINKNEHSNPIFTIIIPTYKRVETLKKAIQSAINQEFEYEYEIIIVDNSEDTSTSSTIYKIIDEFNSEKIQYFVNERNLGICGNWNRGITLSRGKFITFCHDDDILLPNTLSNLYSFSEAFPNKAVLCRFHSIDMDDNYINYFDIDKKSQLKLTNKRTYKLTLYDFILGNVSAGVGDLYIRQQLLEIGGYNNDFYPCFDYALNVEYSYRYGTIYSNIPTSCVRYGLNLTYDVYNQIVETNKRIVNGFLSKLIIPNFIGNYLSNQVLLKFQTELENGFGKSNIKIKNYPIVTLFNFILRLKKYKI